MVILFGLVLLYNSELSQTVFAVLLPILEKSFCKKMMQETEGMTVEELERLNKNLEKELKEAEKK